MYRQQLLCTVSNCYFCFYTRLPSYDQLKPLFIHSVQEKAMVSAKAMNVKYFVTSNGSAKHWITRCLSFFLYFFLSFNPQRARIIKNPDCSTGPLARPFARSLAPLTRSLAPHYSFRSRARDFWSFMLSITIALLFGISDISN